MPSKTLDPGLTARRLILPALLVFLAAFGIYLSTAAPSVLWADAGELQAVALRGGVAHPPGYPSFVLLGQLFGRVLSGDPAHRITVMSGFIGACAVALLFLFLAAALGLSLVAAAGASAILALSFTFWWSAIGPEVYTLATLFFLLALWRTVLALREPSVRRYVLAGLCRVV